MIIVPKNQAENVLLATFASEVLGTSLEAFGFDRYGNPLFQTMGFARGGETLCVFVVYQYVPPNIFIAFASKDPRWASKENLRALGIWIFDDLGCDRMTTLTEKRNKVSRKFQEGVGFQHEGKLRKAAQNDDIIIYGLTKTDHKAWLRKAFNGKTRSSTTT